MTPTKGCNTRAGVCRVYFTPFLFLFYFNFRSSSPHVRWWPHRRKFTKSPFSKRVLAELHSIISNFNLHDISDTHMKMSLTNYMIVSSQWFLNERPPLCCLLLHCAMLVGIEHLVIADFQAVVKILRLYLLLEVDFTSVWWSLRLTWQKQWRHLNVFDLSQEIWAASVKLVKASAPVTIKNYIYSNTLP